MKSKQEVIKALELCAESVTDEYYPCDECPYSDHGFYNNESCSAAMKRDAAELLKNSVEPLIIKKLVEGAENES